MPTLRIQILGQKVLTGEFKMYNQPSEPAFQMKPQKLHRKHANKSIACWTKSAFGCEAKCYKKERYIFKPFISDKQQPAELYHYTDSGVTTCSWWCSVMSHVKFSMVSKTETINAPLHSGRRHTSIIASYNYSTYILPKNSSSVSYNDFIISKVKLLVRPVVAVVDGLSEWFIIIDDLWLLILIQKY